MNTKLIILALLGLTVSGVKLNQDQTGPQGPHQEITDTAPEEGSERRGPPQEGDEPRGPPQANGQSDDDEERPERRGPPSDDEDIQSGDEESDDEPRGPPQDAK